MTVTTTKTEAIQSEKGVHIKQTGNWGSIVLDRPEAMNALSVSMMEDLGSVAREWAVQPDIHGVMISGNGTKAFCAGGDLRSVYNAQCAGNFEFLEHLFRTEYTFTWLLHEFPKPWVAFMHGFCMGGGLGASVHGSHRVIAPGSIISMPEVGIGYFPDVGAASFLAKAPGFCGLYLALTGNHINAEDGIYAGLATHYIALKDFDTIRQELVCMKDPSHSKIDGILNKYVQPRPASFLERHQQEIDFLFGAQSLEKIFSRLEASSSPFATCTRETLKSRSPASLLIAFQLMKKASTMSFREQINLEFLLSQSLVRSHDFREGIRAAVIEKDRQPKWEHGSVSDISSSDIEKLFVSGDNNPLKI